MFPIRLQSDQVEFVILSFEARHVFESRGLGVRVANLAEYLAGMVSNAFDLHSSPDLPSEEERLDGRLHYHHWCQWISRYHL
jgi:hypothetical protein